MALEMPSKRPRSMTSDDERDYCGEPAGKKPRSLPLRISPSCSPRRHFSRRTPSSAGWAVPPTLTPDESSDEELREDFLHASLAAYDISKPNTASTFSSTKANASERNMATSPPSLWKSPTFSRRRSNGISTMTPPPLMNFAATEQPGPNGVRIPTPIYGHFTSTDVNMDSSEASLNSFIHPAGARSQFRTAHNTLSPMMSEENESEAGGDWWARARLPSPAQSPLLSHRMDTDDLASPSVMDALSFENIACHNMQMEADDEGGGAATLVRGAGPPSFLMARRPGDGGQAKKGKLVMGYRADCDKCVKRLPRHYSHIIWD